MAKIQIKINIREGKPQVCIVCRGPLHNKSEYYCSKNCADQYNPVNSEEKSPFLSKWKIRKRKELRDPFVLKRHKVRTKTKELVKEGKIKKKPCHICGCKEVIAHHEDYGNPFDIVWLCEIHHKEYHQGKIALFNGARKWDNKKLFEFGKNKKEFKQKKKETPPPSLAPAGQCTSQNREFALTGRVGSKKVYSKKLSTHEVKSKKMNYEAVAPTSAQQSRRRH